MAKQESVTVELIKNPAVKRQMTAQSARMNSRKWRVVTNQPVIAEVKKKDVAPVVGKLPETANSFVPAHDDLGQGEFAKIESDKETLQKEYEAKTGTKPDGRWNESKLKEKIAALKTNDDEAA